MKRLSVLMLEDDPLDAELVQSSLAEGGFDCTLHRVTKREDFLRAIQDTCAFDLILADYSLPTFDGLSALRLAQERCPDTPFILVSGALGEEVAIDIFRSGATDYVLKHRIERLIPAVARALRESAERRERDEALQALKESEERFRLLLEGVRDHAIFLLDPTGRVISWNPAAERIEGYVASEVIGQYFACFYPAEETAAGVPEENLRAAARDGRFEGEGWRLRKDGTRFWAEVIITALRDARGELTGYSKVTRDISERKRAEEERRRAEEERIRLLECEMAARREAEEANRLKDEFLATVSHELRTPLTAILGWSRLLKAGRQDDPDTLQRAIDTIERNARAQAQIVNDLLDVSRIITGQLRLQVEPLDLSPLLEAAIEPIRTAAEVKSIELELELDPEAGAILGDAERLQQVIWNLLSNATKFTPQGGRITVRLERQNASVRIIVSDSGEGIDPEFLPFVFDRFRQADGTTTRPHGGLGLGLSLVRYLVEMHGGTVLAESPGKGEGATFTVTLPLIAGTVDSEEPRAAQRSELARNPKRGQTSVVYPAHPTPPRLTDRRRRSWVRRRR